MNTAGLLCGPVALHTSLVIQYTNTMVHMIDCRYRLCYYCCGIKVMCPTTCKSDCTSDPQLFAPIAPTLPATFAPEYRNPLLRYDTTALDFGSVVSGGDLSDTDAERSTF